MKPGILWRGRRVREAFLHNKKTACVCVFLTKIKQSIQMFMVHKYCCGRPAGGPCPVAFWEVIVGTGIPLLLQTVPTQSQIYGFN